MKIAIEGCCHGELDKIYDTVRFLEQANNIKIDLLLICGDFQAVRNKGDLQTMAVPQKYAKLNTFYKYYSGEKEAPVLTVFIGGNHEASNYMQELPYGGWVAKNIYYMGYAGVIQIGGLRIGGLSGIFKGRDFNKGHFEHPPYTGDTKRSVYHIRNLEVFRLKQLTRPMDIFLSHDWPSNIAKYGNMNQLFRRKPFLREEVLNGSLGSPPAEEILLKLQPSYWFAAHLHVKFTAHVQHSAQKATKFLSLDKCLPRRQFLQVLDIPHREQGPFKIKLDPEWLCVLKGTNHLLNLRPAAAYMPGPGCSERYNFEVSDAEISSIREDFGGDFTLPENFEPTAPTLYEPDSNKKFNEVLINPQTTLLCAMLDITDPNAVIKGLASQGDLSTSTLNPDEIDIASDDKDSDDMDNESGLPSDISSSMDVSYANSSFSTSFTGSTSTPKKVEVQDDDEEFKAILKMQKSRRSISSEESPSKLEKSDTLLLGGEFCLQNSPPDGSEPVSSTTNTDDDGLSAILSAQKKVSGRSVSEVTEKSVMEASEVSATEKSREELSSDSSQANTDDDKLLAILSAQKRVTEKSVSSSSQAGNVTSDSGEDVQEKYDHFDSSSQDSARGDSDSNILNKSFSCQSDSCTSDSDSKSAQLSEVVQMETNAAGRNGSPGVKRPSPSADITSSGKKLKRRNVAVYSILGGEEGSC